MILPLFTSPIYIMALPSGEYTEGAIAHIHLMLPSGEYANFSIAHIHYGAAIVRIHWICTGNIYDDTDPEHWPYKSVTTLTYTLCARHPPRHPMCPPWSGKTPPHIGPSSEEKALARVKRIYPYARHHPRHPMCPPWSGNPTHRPVVRWNKETLDAYYAHLPFDLPW
jgi:hypothetical protein